MCAIRTTFARRLECELLTTILVSQKFEIARFSELDNGGMDEWDHLLASSESLVQGVGTKCHPDVSLLPNLQQFLCQPAGPPGDAKSQPYNGPGPAVVRKAGVQNPT